MANVDLDIFRKTASLGHNGFILSNLDTADNNRNVLKIWFRAIDNLIF